MFRPFARFILIVTSAAAFSVAAGAQANEPRAASAGLTADRAPAVAATKTAACSAPTTIGEDYAGVPCLYTSAEAPAKAGQSDPPGSSAESADCQPLASFGEDYSGISCTEGRVGSERVVAAPFFSVGEDFLGTLTVTQPEDKPAVAHRSRVTAKRSTAAAGSN